ncbi:DUF2975 domain-containing protein [Luteimonas sp. RC10]|uniref:DUF2975 domain-containing protein n=1 Tax=Luteimonas sp. RC10 TaxID=2587035 RepID=UPI00161DFFBE|nr:DUF2975 domain-containing protein [Luteimonas sp. RC10]MBB3344787.1 hypothetical protein [Luteimonas sp. RC10]
MRDTGAAIGVMRFARGLRWAALLAGSAYTLVTAVAVFAGAGWGGRFISATVEAGGLPREWAAALALLLAAITLAAMQQLAGMLGRIGKDRVFSSAMIRRFRFFCLLFLTILLVRSALPAAAAFLLAMQAGAGAIRLTFDGGDVITLVIAGLLYFVASLFEQAARWEEDSRTIV